MTRYAELHCKSNFSFLEGASHADELCQQAKRLGYEALAIVDRHSVSGTVRAHTAALEYGLKLIVGVELHPLDAGPLVLWAPDRQAYAQLTRLLTVGCRRAVKGSCELYVDDIANHAAGVLAGTLLQAWKEDGPSASEVRRDCERYAEIFGDRCYLLASLHCGPDDARQLAQWNVLAKAIGVPLAAAGDVQYHVPRRKSLHDALAAIRCGTTIDDAGDLLDPNAQRHLKSLEQLARLFEAAPGSLERACEAAERCHFSLAELRYEYPSELALLEQEHDDRWLPTPACVSPALVKRKSEEAKPIASPVAESVSDGADASVAQTRHAARAPESTRPLMQCLVRLTWRGAEARYPHGVPEAVRLQVEHELELIGQLQYEAYFLTVWDLVRFARQRDILCQGRGSA
ncbi:MAG: PHP domain-containing protein, partial [Planctomycetales bacterium]|nr:PHP domain-containing protein [Planctomycetales bacterium]